MVDVFRTAPPEAPVAPREITPDIEADAAVFGRFLRLFGAIWTFVGGGVAIAGLVVVLSLGPRGPLFIAPILGGAFFVAGATCWAIGAGQRQRALAIYRDGVETRGEVVEIFLDRTVRINNRHPYRVVYTIAVEGRTTRGVATFWDDSPPRVSPGDAVAALYAKGSPSHSVLWTRIEHGRAHPRARIAGFQSAPAATPDDATSGEPEVSPGPRATTSRDRG